MLPLGTFFILLIASSFHYACAHFYDLEQTDQPFISPFCSTTRTNQIPVYHRHRHSQHRRNKRSALRSTGTLLRRTSGTVHEYFQTELDNAESDNEFLVRIQLGTPAQSFWAVPDSGTPQTWVYGPKCCFHANHSFFHPSKSSTFHPMPLDNYNANAHGNRTTATYGTGLTALTLKMANDIFALPNVHHAAGHLNSTHLRIEGQEFGLVETNGDPDQLFRKMEGLLGFAPSGTALTEMNGTSHATPMENWIKQGALRKPMVTFTLVKQKHASFEHQGGRLTIGDLDEEAIDGPMTWIESNSSVYWATNFDADSLQIGKRDVYRINETLPKRLIFDTGSAIIYLPNQVAEYANGMLSGAFKLTRSQKWVIACEYGRRRRKKGKSHRRNDKPIARDVNDELFTVQLGGRIFTVPSEDMVSFPDRPWAIDTISGQEFCLTSIQSGPDAFAVLGNTFIKNHVLTLDYGDGTATGRRIGIADRKDLKNDKSHVHKH